MGKPYTIKRLFNSMNGNPQKVRYLKPFHKNIPTYVRSYNGNKIILHKIKGCTYSGIKSVYRITLENGKTIKTTECHRMMTQRGWVPTGHLEIGKDTIICDDMKCNGKTTKKRKTHDTFVQNLWHHPYAPTTKTANTARGHTKRIEIHRAIFEAALNFMTLDQYKITLRTDPEQAKSMSFLDPKKWHIHHKDGNHYNNDINNLNATPVKEHLEIHGDYNAFGQGIPTYSTVKSIKYIGLEETYDIECEDPHHNFVANGMVVHNSGKTELFIELSDRFVAETGKAVLILSHLGLLTTQTAKRFQKRKPKLKVGILQAGEYPRKDADVVIGTMQTSRGDNHAAILDAKLTKKVGLIIVDEAHYLYCPSYDKVFSKWAEAKIVGVTATPFRNKQLMTGFFDEIAYSISLRELIDGGYLVEPKLHEITQKGDDPEGTLAQTVALYKQEQPTAPGIVYVDSIVNAGLIRQMFESEGISARTITSEITGSDRDDILKSFEMGKTQVLCNVNVLTAGFDGPRVKTIMMPFGCGSPTQYLQRIGRGLRTHDGKTHCDVYVFGRTPAIAGGIYQQFHQEALTNKKKKENETVFDDLTYGDLSTEEYEWTQTVIHACHKLKALGSQRLSDILAHKDFPQKFMSNIAEMIQRMAKLNPTTPTSIPMSDKQEAVLLKAGFKADKIKDWSISEANIIIGLLMQPHTASIGNKWVFASGKHAGKHVKDVPWAYKRFVVDNLPNSPVAKLIREYHNQAFQS
jgi:superfamily II DNA or RNA helicase